MDVPASRRYSRFNLPGKRCLGVRDVVGDTIDPGVRRNPSPLEDSREDGRLCRRSFLANLGLGAAAATVLQSTALRGHGWLKSAEAATLDEVIDTFNGLLTFLVPGPDDYSLAQRVSTPEPGAIEANVTQAMIDTIDDLAPYQPSFSAVVASILNDLATLVNPSAGGRFASHFAHLAFPEKAAVIQIMDSTDDLKPLTGVLLPFGAFLVYSEAGVFDAATRSLSGTPVGWTLSGYPGVSDGRDEFLGYFGGKHRIR